MPWPKRSGRRLDADRMSIFGMTRRLRADLAELFQLVDRHLGIAGQVEQGVEQHGAVAGRQDEAVAVGPVRADGSNFRTRVQSAVAMSAAPIGMPGWPDFAASTPSIASAGSHWPSCVRHACAHENVCGVSPVGKSREALRPQGFGKDLTRIERLLYGATMPSRRPKTAGPNPIWTARSRDCRRRSPCWKSPPRRRSRFSTGGPRGIARRHAGRPPRGWRWIWMGSSRARPEARDRQRRSRDEARSRRPRAERRSGRRRRRIGEHLMAVVVTIAGRALTGWPARKGRKATSSPWLRMSIQDGRIEVQFRRDRRAEAGHDGGAHDRRRIVRVEGAARHALEARVAALDAETSDVREAQDARGLHGAGAERRRRPDQSSFPFADRQGLSFPAMAGKPLRSEFSQRSPFQKPRPSCSRQR